MDGASSTATVVEGMRVQLTRRHTGRMPTVLATMDRTTAIGAALRRHQRCPGVLAGADRYRRPHALASLGHRFSRRHYAARKRRRLSRCTSVSGLFAEFPSGLGIGNWDAAASRCRKVNQASPVRDHYTIRQPRGSRPVWPLRLSDAAVSRTVVHVKRFYPKPLSTSYCSTLERLFEIRLGEKENRVGILRSAGGRARRRSVSNSEFDHFRVEHLTLGRQLDERIGRPLCLATMRLHWEAMRTHRCVQRRPL